MSIGLFSLVHAFLTALLIANAADSQAFAEVPIESDGDALTVTLDVDGQTVLAAREFSCPNLMWTREV